MTTPIVYAGIDYSMSCPCITVFSGEEFKLENCKIYYLTDNKKYQKKFYGGIIEGLPIPKYTSNEERFDFISAIFMYIINSNEVTSIGIENYAFAGKGLVFNIAENTGLLKHKIWKLYGNPVSVYAPAQVKKMATGKGNADKNSMYQAFLDETKLDLVKELAYTKSTIDSPIGDIVDSYFICKHHVNVI